MNNYAYELARVYYAITNQSPALIPTTHTEAFWAERIYRHAAGLPDSVAGGRTSSFWLERWFYLRTGQTHRMATGVMDDWFWLSKLYASYVGTDVNGLLQPAADEFWAQQLAAVVGASAPATAPEMRVLGNGNEIADGDATPSATDHTQFAATTFGTTVTRTFTIENTGDADLEDIVVTPPAGFTLTDAPASTIAALGSDTFTIRCDAGSVATLTGTVSIASNDSDTPYTFDISCVVANTYDNFIQNTIAPLRWHKFQQTSGTNEPNAMNPGTNDATISGATLGQSGVGGAANEAYSFDGVDDVVDSPADANINGILPATWSIVASANNRGEGGFGRLFRKTSDVDFFLTSVDATAPFSVTANIFFSGGTLVVTWNDVLPASTLTMLALRLNADNTADLFVNGTKQTTSAAGSGTKSTNAAGILIGNNPALGATLDGKVEDFWVENSAVSDANLLTAAQLKGLA